MRYVRDNRTHALLLKDSNKLEEFLHKQFLSERMESLQTEINNLKTEVQKLKFLMQSTKESN
jgi:hypothetical protein